MIKLLNTRENAVSRANKLLDFLNTHVNTVSGVNKLLEFLNAHDNAVVRAEKKKSKVNPRASAPARAEKKKSKVNPRASAPARAEKKKSKVNPRAGAPARAAGRKDLLLPAKHYKGHKAKKSEAIMIERNIFWIGQQFNRWTIIGDCITARKGEKKWLCRCECGTERYVLERSLKHGGSKSCGCLQKEEAKKAIALNLQGQAFGELTVLHVAEHQRKNRGVWWTCKCSCGNMYDVPGTLLINGKRTNCGGKVHEKNYASSDISGQKFYRLTAMYPINKRDKKGSVVWHCRCECGNEIDVSYNNLVHCNMKSCGCQKKEHDEKLRSYLTHVAGTSIDVLKSKKIPSDNTTGYRGVYFIKGKYVAKIVFQKKAYHLGTYDNIAEAAEARKRAEKVLFDGVAAFYEKWKERADRDAKWAEENPVSISVDKDPSGELIVSYSPVL